MAGGALQTGWQALCMGARTETDAIRQAYVVMMAEIHPENDPKGLKQLGEA